MAAAYLHGGHFSSGGLVACNHPSAGTGTITNPSTAQYAPGALCKSTTGAVLAIAGNDGAPLVVGMDYSTIQQAHSDAVQFCTNLGSGWFLPNSAQLIKILTGAYYLPGFLKTIQSTPTLQNVFWSSTPRPDIPATWSRICYPRDYGPAQIPACTYSQNDTPDSRFVTLCARGD